MCQVSFIKYLPSCSQAEETSPCSREILQVLYNPYKYNRAKDQKCRKREEPLPCSMYFGTVFKLYRENLRDLWGINHTYFSIERYMYWNLLLVVDEYFNIYNIKSGLHWPLWSWLYLAGFFSSHHISTFQRLFFILNKYRDLHWKYLSKPCCDLEYIVRFSSVNSL